MLFKNIQALLFPFYANFNINYLIYIILIYYLFIFSFFYYILFLNKKVVRKHETISIFKDKEFILFKTNLFNFYYSTIIILLFFIFKNNGLYLLLDLNLYFIYLIFSIIIIYYILLSNFFNLILFNLYLKTKNNINLFNSINWNSTGYSTNTILNLKYKNKFNYNLSSLRSYSTLNPNNKDPENNSESSNTENLLAIKKFKNKYKGGYLGYQNIQSFGDVSHLNMAGVDREGSREIYEYAIELKDKIKNYLNDIPENITYSILPVIRTLLENGEYKTITISNKSIKITRNTSTNLLASKLIDDVLNAVFIYDLRGADIVLYILDRPWLSDKDFNQDMTRVTEVLDNQIEKELYSWSKLSDLNTSGKVNRLKNYKYLNNYMDNYGEPIYDKNNNLIGYKLNEFEYASVETSYNDNNLLTNKILIKDFNLETLSFEGEALTSWTDTKLGLGFIRELNSSLYFYDQYNNLINIKIKYNQPKFPVYKPDSNLSGKIGSLDFETYGTNQGLGHHKVYAAGFAIKEKTELYYKELGESSESFINNFFLNIFLNNKINLDGYTFYVHNLGRFDSIFILKSLTINNDFILTPIWKDTSILSLTIKYLNKEIILLDSLQMIPHSLENILISFNCSINKGYFPYDFVNSQNLNYIGNKPNIKYYKNISEQEYLNIPETNWNLKLETLSYLKSDVEGLLEAMLKFRDSIHKKYNLNITKHKTLPGLALTAYTSKYLPENLINKFKMVKGHLENIIRSAYFGGNVEVYINSINTAYYYDMNSQYPEAMLKDMPIGNPVLTLETDLSKIFGFIYCEITPPGYDVLQVPFIQHRDPKTNLVICPNNKYSSFRRLIFSEEAKYAVKYGYKINIEYSYIFERGKDLFTDYVNDHYKIKSTATDPVQKNISKLFLNSLYGRLGMNEILDKMEIVDKEKAIEVLDLTHNVSIISELSNNKYLVKYSSEIDWTIKELYLSGEFNLKEQKSIRSSFKKIKKLEINKSKTFPSAVHIAAAISSYARILINEYKNIPGNPCIMSDTDSAVLPYPLPDHLVGKGIGQMKLVHKINSGIFIRKKLYAIIDSDNQEVVKSSGINPNKLNYNSFENLLKGEYIEVKGTNFNVNWKDLEIKVVETKIKLNGLQGKIKTIYNTPDVNFKFISFSVKYNLIVHPLYPIITDQKEKLKLELIDSVDPQKTIPSLSNESDIFILFSKYEIILFIVTLSISIIFLIIYTLFFK